MQGEGRQDGQPQAVIEDGDGQGPLILWEWNVHTGACWMSGRLDWLCGEQSAGSFDSLEHLLAVVDDADRARVLESLRDVSRSREVTDFRFRCALTGTELRCHCRGFVDREGQPDRVFGVLALERRNRVRRNDPGPLARFGSLIDGMCGEEDPAAVAGALAASARQWPGACFAAVYSYNTEEGALCLMASEGLGRELLREASFLEAGDSFSGHAVSEGRVLVAHRDGFAEALAPRVRDAVLAGAAEALVAVPLRFHDEILGVLAIGFADAGAAPEADDPACLLVGQIAGLALANVFHVTRMHAETIERERAERMLLEKTEGYRAFITNSADGIVRFDVFPPVELSLPLDRQVELICERARVAECNRVAAQMRGMPSISGLVGRAMAENGVELDSCREAMSDFIRKGYRLSGREMQLLRQPGPPLWVEMSAVGMIEDDRLVRLWVTYRDVQERREHLAALEYQATHDALTGLPNRTWLTRELDTLILSADPQRSLALVLIDLDHFKEINDTLDHGTGDRLLQQIAPRLQSLLEGGVGDVVRLGGDEFGVLIRKVINEQQVRMLSEHMIQAIRRPFHVGGLRLEVSASAGIALFPQHGDNAAHLLRRADVALYQAKGTPDRCRIYRADLDHHHPRRLTLLADFGRALERGQLALHYQPQVEVGSRRLLGFEALARWTHPEQGLVPPGEFAPLVEHSEYIAPFTEWVIDQALAQWRRWEREGRMFKVAVNLSARNLMDEALLDTVARLLEAHGADPRCLELEVTESALIADPQRAADTLQALNALGVTLAIDDFGTGYSSLSHLRRLPLQALKIDLSFVRTMLENEADRAIVQSTIGLAHSLGLKVIAEGVEEAAILQALAGMGCDKAQGYHIARPLPVDRLADWLQAADWQPR